MKRTNWFLCTVIVALSLCLIYFIRLNSEYHKQYMQRGVLTNFDDIDYERMNVFYERFHERKGDNVMLISPTIDSGPIIYDLISNGSQVWFSMDETRDGYSGKVSNCDGYDDEEIKGYLQYQK